MSDPVPDFAVKVGGADVTALIRDRLVSLTVTDNSGKEADTIELVLDDRDNLIASPRRGAILSVSIGYRGAPLVSQGDFVVDEVEPEGPPDRLTIRGKSADMRASLKAAKSRHWRATTVGAIVTKVAAEHGLQAAVSPALAGRAVAHLDQTNESDLHFLTRLGREHDAVAGPKSGRLVFAAAGEGVSASGKALPAVQFTRSDLINWRATVADREAHGTVRARYRDVGAGRTKFAEAGGGGATRTLRHMHRSKAHAEAASAAELKRLGRDSLTVEITVEGGPHIAAQTPLELINLRSELNGRWIAECVEHRMDFGGGGFTTRIEGKRP